MDKKIKSSIILMPERIYYNLEVNLMRHCEQKKGQKARCGKSTRRKFIKTLTGAAASVFVLGRCSSPSTQGNDSEIPEVTVLSPRSGLGNPYVTNDGKPVLVSVEGTNFPDMLRAGLETLGGLGMLIAPEQDVLIKPNLNHQDPFPGISSAAGIADIVREVRNITSGNINVGDEGYTPSSSVYNYLDLESFVNDAGGNLITFSRSYDVRRDSWEQSTPNFKVYKEVYDAPVIINTCVLKRHNTAYMTCAIKCNVGTVYGSGGAGTRRWVHEDSGDILRFITEIAGLVNPELNIVDARSILTGGGPWITDGVVVDGVNRIVICGDIVATDMYCARIMEQYDSGFTTSLASPIWRFLNAAEELGLGTSDLNQVEIIEISV
jgi:uncharacterized protein (DUF362 family)